MKIVTRTRKQVFKKWIAALRSGKYKQGKRSLRYMGGFCCLGVVCDLARKDGGPRWNGATGWLSGDSFMGKHGELPEVIRTFLGIDHWQQGHLIEMNDRKDATFEQIADYIETRIMPKALKRD